MALARCRSNAPLVAGSLATSSRCKQSAAASLLPALHAPACLSQSLTIEPGTRGRRALSDIDKRFRREDQRRPAKKDAMPPVSARDDLCEDLSCFVAFWPKDSLSQFLHLSSLATAANEKRGEAPSGLGLISCREGQLQHRALRGPIPPAPSRGKLYRVTALFQLARLQLGKAEKAQMLRRHWAARHKGSRVLNRFSTIVVAQGIDQNMALRKGSRWLRHKLGETRFIARLPIDLYRCRADTDEDPKRDPAGSCNHRPSSKTGEFEDTALRIRSRTAKAARASMV